MVESLDRNFYQRPVVPILVDSVQEARYNYVLGLLLDLLVFSLEFLTNEPQSLERGESDVPRIVKDLLSQSLNDVEPLPLRNFERGDSRNAESSSFSNL